MNETLRRAGLFALTAFLFFVVADFALWGFYQGMHPREELGSRLLLRGLLHASIFVLSAIGAVMAFALFRCRLPSPLAVSLSAVGFGVTSLFALVFALAAAGVIGAAIWLLAGSALAASVAALTVSRHVG